MSEEQTIGKLALALSKAQMEFTHAGKDGEVRTEKQGTRKYATISSMIDACREALGKNELAVIQRFLPSEAGWLTLETVLMHSSGESLSSILSLPIGQAVSMNPLQWIGSVTTYMRKYTLCALLNLAADDDDGASAGGATKGSNPSKSGTNGERASLPADKTYSEDAGSKGEAQAVPLDAIWPGPGLCPYCHCPPDKKHGNRCNRLSQDTTGADNRDLAGVA